MNDTNLTPELELKESVRQVMQTLPEPIRQFITNERYVPIVQRLLTQYGLHIDQGTVLEQQILLLLMGIKDPDTFATSLSEDAHLPQETIQNIMNDINQKIFVPLQAQMRTQSVPIPPAPTASFTPTTFPTPPTIFRPASPPPQNLPGTAVDAQPKVAAPETSAPLPPSSLRPKFPAPMKEYGVDPYREQIG